MQTDQFDSFVEDFLGERLERPIIIVAASKIEDLLLLILSKYFLDPTGDDDLLKGDNPLSTFSSRIKICSRLGIIDVSLVKILNIVRKIRNSCAHSIEFNLKVSPLKEHLSELRKGLINRPSFVLTKQRYFNNIFSYDYHELQCLLVAVCVILEAINERTVKTLGINDTLHISKK